VLRKLIIFLVLIVAMASTHDAFAKPKPKGAELEAALARCEDVNIESLEDCGIDPLTNGKAKINKNGDVKVVVVGGEPEVTYGVYFRSIDDSEEKIGELTTDSDGDGNFEQKGLFSSNDVGSGNIVLQREVEAIIKDQFVTAFKVIAEVVEIEDEGSEDEGSDDEEPEFEAGLVRCGEINRPVALNPDDCGSDELQKGKVEIDHEDGDVEVEVSKAKPNVSYTVFYRPLSGGDDIFIGSLATNSKGNGEMEVEGFFYPLDIGSGNIVLQREELDQFMTGFHVTKKAKAMKAVFKSGMVECREVNQGTSPPSQLSNCGTDSLEKGDVIIDEKGLVRVLLVHAEPNTEYEVCYRPIDGSPEIDLEMVVKTNPAGNANKKQKWFDIGTVGSGNVVLKRSGNDQFVTGFRVIKGNKGNK
jgi:hypothetical protein